MRILRSFWAYIAQHPRLLGVLLVTGLVYANTITGALVWDDVHFITGWPEIRAPFDNLSSLLIGEVPVGYGSIYRPVRSLVYAVSFTLWGEWIVGYHIQAILLHLLVSSLVYRLAWRLFDHKMAATLGALLFGMHPIHAESVAWITASFDLFGIALGLGAIVLLLEGKNAKTRRVGLGLALLSYFGNEMMLVLPILMLWIDLFRKKFQFNKLKLGLYKNLLLLQGFYWLLRFGFLGFELNQSSYLFGDVWKHLLIMIVGFWEYIKVMTVPFNLSVVRYLTPEIGSFVYFDAGNLINLNFPSNPFWLMGLWMLVGLVTGIAWINRKKFGYLLFGWGWIVISLLPVMQLIPQQILWAERHAYLASMGLGLLIAGLVAQFYGRSKGWILGGLLSVLLIFGYITFQRNQVWNNNVSLWEAALSEGEESYYVWRNLAGAYFDSGRKDQAVATMQRALELNPNHPKDLLVMAAMYHDQTRYPELIALLEPIIETVRLPLATEYLADAYYAETNFEKASFYYTWTLQLEPQHEKAYQRLIELKSKSLLTGEDDPQGFE